MFDSGISVKNLIDELKNTEVDIALEIPNSTYVEWLNSLQQLLYTEVIKEQKKVVLTGYKESPVNLSAIPTENNENTPRFEDIYAVYADSENGIGGRQLIKSSVASGIVFDDTYYKDNNNIGYNTEFIPEELTIIYIVKPALIIADENDEVDESRIMIPIEFIDLVKAKLRGEAYKLANEDSIAAKWLNDYNTLLETFKAWITEKSSNFGI